MGLLANRLAATSTTATSLPALGTTPFRSAMQSAQAIEDDRHGTGLLGFVGNIGADIRDVALGLGRLGGMAIGDIADIAKMNFEDVDVLTPEFVWDMGGALVDDLKDRYGEGDIGEELYDHPLSFIFDALTVAGGAGAAARGAAGVGRWGDIARASGLTTAAKQAQVASAVSKYRALQGALEVSRGSRVANLAEDAGRLQRAGAGLLDVVTGRRGAEPLDAWDVSMGAQLQDAGQLSTVDDIVAASKALPVSVRNYSRLLPAGDHWIPRRPTLLGGVKREGEGSFDWIETRIADPTSGFTRGYWGSRNPLVQAVWNNPVQRRILSRSRGVAVNRLNELEGMAARGDRFNPYELDQMRVAVKRMRAQRAERVATPFYGKFVVRKHADDYISKLVAGGIVKRTQQREEMRAILAEATGLDAMHEIIQGEHGRDIVEVADDILDQHLADLGYEDDTVAARDVIYQTEAAAAMAPDVKLTLLNKVLDGRIPLPETFRYVDPPDLTPETAPNRARYKQELHAAADRAGVPLEHQEFHLALTDSMARALTESIPEYEGDVDRVYARMQVEFAEKWKGMMDGALQQQARRAFRGAVKYQKNGRYKGTRWVPPQPMVDTRRLTKWFYRGLEKHPNSALWYERSAQIIAQVTEGMRTRFKRVGPDGREYFETVDDYELFADILAVLSIGQLPRNNFDMAWLAYSALKRGELHWATVDTPSGPRLRPVDADGNVIPGIVRGTSANEHAQLLREVTSGHLVRHWEEEIANGTGDPDLGTRLLDDVLEEFERNPLGVDNRMKVRAFSANLKMNGDRGTMDRRMGLLFGVFTSGKYKGGKSMTAPTYRRMEGWIREVQQAINAKLPANHAPYSVAQVQAVLWSVAVDFVDDELVRVSKQLDQAEDLGISTTPETRELRDYYNNLALASTSEGGDPEDFMHAWERLVAKNGEDITQGLRQQYGGTTQRLTQNLADIIKGEIIFGPDYRTTVRLFRNADFTTLTHENAHFLRRLLPDDVVDGLWKVYAERFGVSPEQVAEEALQQTAFNRADQAGRTRLASIDTPQGEVQEGMYVSVGEPMESVARSDRGQVITSGIPRVTRIYQKGNKFYAWLDNGKRDVPVDDLHPVADLDPYSMGLSDPLGMTAEGAAAMQLGPPMMLPGGKKGKAGRPERSSLSGPRYGQYVGEQATLAVKGYGDNDVQVVDEITVPVRVEYRGGQELADVEPWVRQGGQWSRARDIAGPPVRQTAPGPEAGPVTRAGLAGEAAEAAELDMANLPKPDPDSNATRVARDEAALAFLALLPNEGGKLDPEKFGALRTIGESPGYLLMEQDGPQSWNYYMVSKKALNDRSSDIEQLTARNDIGLRTIPDKKPPAPDAARWGKPSFDVEKPPARRIRQAQRQKDIEERYDAARAAGETETREVVGSTIEREGGEYTGIVRPADELAEAAEAVEVPEVDASQLAAQEAEAAALARLQRDLDEAPPEIMFEAEVDDAALEAMDEYMMRHMFSEAADKGELSTWELEAAEEMGFYVSPTGDFERFNFPYELEVGRRIAFGGSDAEHTMIGEVMEIDPNELTFGNPVETARVRAIGDDELKFMPVAFKYGDQLILNEGNHRVARARVNQEPTIKVAVFEDQVLKDVLEAPQAAPKPHTAAYEGLGKVEGKAVYEVLEAADLGPENWQYVSDRAFAMWRGDQKVTKALENKWKKLSAAERRGFYEKAAREAKVARPSNQSWMYLQRNGYRFDLEALPPGESTRIDVDGNSVVAHVGDDVDQAALDRAILRAVGVADEDLDAELRPPRTFDEIQAEREMNAIVDEEAEIARLVDESLPEDDARAVTEVLQERGLPIERWKDVIENAFYAYAESTSRKDKVAAWNKLSVDTRKKWVRQYLNKGKEAFPKGRPTYDTPFGELPTEAPPVAPVAAVAEDLGDIEEKIATLREMGMEVTPEQEAEMRAAAGAPRDVQAEQEARGGLTEAEEAAAQLDNPYARAAMEADEAEAAGVPEPSEGPSGTEPPPPTGPPPVDPGREWSREMEEAFAEDFERWVYEQLNPGDRRVEPAFRALAASLRELWAKVRGYTMERELIPDEAAAVFDRYFSKGIEAAARPNPKHGLGLRRRSRVLAAAGPVAHPAVGAQVMQQPVEAWTDLVPIASAAHQPLRRRLAEAFGWKGFTSKVKDSDALGRKAADQRPLTDALQARVYVDTWDQADGVIAKLEAAGLRIVGIQDTRGMPGEFYERGLRAYVEVPEQPDFVAEIEIGTAQYGVFRDSTSAHESAAQHLQVELFRVEEEIRRIEDIINGLTDDEENAKAINAMTKEHEALEEMYGDLMRQREGADRIMEGLYEMVVDEIDQHYGGVVGGNRARRVMNQLRLWNAKNVETELFSLRGADGTPYWDFDYAFQRLYYPIRKRNGGQVNQETGELEGGGDAYQLDDARAAEGLPQPVYFPHMKPPPKLSDWVMQRGKGMFGARKMAENKNLKRWQGRLMEDDLFTGEPGYLTDIELAYEMRAARAIKMADTGKMVRWVTQNYGRKLADPSALGPGEVLYAPDFLNALFRAVVTLEDRMGTLLSRLPPDILDVTRAQGAEMATDVIRRGLQSMGVDGKEAGALMRAIDEVMPTVQKEFLALTSKGVDYWAIPKTVADRLEASVKGPLGISSNANLRLFWDAPTNLWRNITLYGRPAWLVNNFFGNVAFLKIGGGRFTDVIRQVTDPEFRDMAAQLADNVSKGSGGQLDIGFFQSTQQQYQAMLGSAGNEAMGEVIQAMSDAARGNRVFKPLYKWGDYMKLANQLIENYFRRAGAIRAAEQVGDPAAIRSMARRFWTDKKELERMLVNGIPDEGAERVLGRVNEFFGDYSRMSPMERHVIRRFLFPFWGFYRHVIGLFLRLPSEYPGRFMVIRAIAETTEQMVAEFGPMPEWMSGMVPFGGQIQEQGDTRFISPAGPNPFNVLSDSWMSMLHPAWKIGMERATGKDSFTGRPFSDPDVVTPYGSEQQFRIIRDDSGKPIDVVPVENVVPPIGVHLMSQVPQYDMLKNLAAGGRAYDTQGILGSLFGGPVTTSAGEVVRPVGYGETVGKMFGISTFPFDVPGYQERFGEESEAALAYALRQYGAEQG